MNRLPEVKQFLKGGEAEEYENVEVRYIKGRKAILTIYDDEQELEKVTLSDYKTREEMHKMMVGKGFAKKSENTAVEL